MNATPPTGNGDFLALLPSSPLAQLPVASGTRPMPLEATTVLAFHCADGICVAGDHRATAGNVIFSDDTEKILDLDSRSLLAIAGSPAMAFEIARTLRFAFEFFRRSQLQAMSLAGKVRALSRLLRDNLPATLQGVGAVMPLFAGTANDGEPTLFFYDPLGADFRAAEYAASGSGSGSIKAVLQYLIDWGRPRPRECGRAEAIVLANRLLRTAADFDAATGGIDPSQGLFGTIKLLGEQGVETISTDEQAQAWRDAATRKDV